jgi:hypothetical protein
MGQCKGTIRGMFTTLRVWEGASHMGQSNAGMGQDRTDIRVRASSNRPSKLFMPY